MGNWLIIGIEPYNSNSVASQCIESLSWNSVFLPIPGSQVELCQFSQGLPVNIIKSTHDTINDATISMIEDLTNVNHDHSISVIDNSDLTAGSVHVDACHIELGLKDLRPDRKDEYIGMLSNLILSMTTYGPSTISEGLSTMNILETDAERLPQCILEPIPSDFMSSD